MLATIATGGEYAPDPLWARLDVIDDIITTVDEGLANGTAAVDLGERLETGSPQLTVVLLGKVGIDAEGEARFYVGSQVGVTAWNRFGTGLCCARVIISMGGLRPEYLLAPRDPKDSERAVAGVDLTTARQDITVSSILKATRFNPTKARGVVRRETEIEAARQRSRGRPNSGNNNTVL